MQQEELGNAAALLGSSGDFSGYGNLYGLTPDQMGTLQRQWMASNPDLAYNSGMIDAEQYHAITGNYPAGYNGAGSGYSTGWYQKALGQMDEWNAAHPDNKVTKAQALKLGHAGDMSWASNYTIDANGNFVKK